MNVIVIHLFIILSLFFLYCFCLRFTWVALLLLLLLLKKKKKLSLYGLLFLSSSCYYLHFSYSVNAFEEGLKFWLDYSAKFCDVDENGVQHLVLCRVIMGNMEVVRSGSRQSLPGCKDYDSGVDDLQNPSIYIVWTMNMNTHIYPEFVVSFKISSNIEGEYDSF